MEFTYNYRNGKEEILIHTDAKYLDEKTLGIIQARKDLFLPVNVQDTREGWLFICDIRELVNLRAWMAEASEQEQRRMRTEIMSRQREIFQMGIREENLLTNERNMYVDMKTQHIRFICIAVGELPDLPDLPPVPPAPVEDLTEGDDKVASVEELLGIHQPKDEEATCGFGEFFSEEREESISEDEEKTVILKPENIDEEKTVLLRQVKQEICGKLVRCATGENFALKHQVNIIGKSNTRADICIRNNPTIGNMHCMIIWEKNNFYLEDNQSLNGTYLENRKLEPGQRMLLQAENKIRLSDEEFIFRTE